VGAGARPLARAGPAPAPGRATAGRQARAPRGGAPRLQLHSRGAERGEAGVGAQRGVVNGAAVWRQVVVVQRQHALPQLLRDLPRRPRP
jgi:hypothetical protein